MLLMEGNYFEYIVCDLACAVSLLWDQIEICDCLFVLTKKSSLSGMYDDYIENGNARVSYELYRQVFETENIGFGEPSQDECPVCLNYKNHISDAKESDAHDQNTCDICSQAISHKGKADVARQHYESDMTKAGTYSADMQKVIIIPKLTTKEHIFVSRLVCFNETFSSGVRTGHDYTVLWHEGISGRKAGDVASSYVKFISTSGEDDPILWTDNCGGQNKNWTLFTALVSLVNAEWGPNTVTIKYLEKGHTFMGADHVHGLIGKRMRRSPEIVTFDDLTELIDKSGRNIKPVVMNVDDFYFFTPENRQRKSKKHGTLPLLADIVEVKFEQGSSKMFIKESFDSDYSEIDFLKPKFDRSVFPEKHNVPRGISTSKKRGILNLLGHIPNSKKKFYAELVENDASEDLVGTRT